MTVSVRRGPIRAIAESPWALHPQTLARIVEWGANPERSAAGVVPMDGSHNSGTRVGSVSIIPVYGVIEHRSDWMTEMLGGTSVDGIRAALAADLADPAVKSIVLDIDSPGGTVAGLTELASDIRSARGGSKPIVAVANAFAASAAYWIAAQADEIVATPSAQVGSVGVYAVHQDVSRMLDEMGVTTTLVSAGPHKVDGNEFEPLSDAAREDIQTRVDASYQQFLADVAAGRRVSVGQVEEKYGGGRVLTARKALAAGMVDRVESMSATLGRLSSTTGRRRAMTAEADGPEISAEADDTAPFALRIDALAAEAEAVAEHARERARLRGKEGRAAFSTATERALRTIHDALGELLALDDPAPAPLAPVEPVPTVVQPPIAANPYRHLSDDEWLRHLEAMKPA